VDVQAAQDKIQALQRSRATAVAAAKKAGQDYLDKAATAPECDETASGLIITTLAPGAATRPRSAIA
jgi:FKBP-type peptidyl-prolyl cis-trans isomerase